MADDELEEMLNRMGSESVPPVDGAFANRLETDLRTQRTTGVGPLRQPAWWLRPSTIVAVGVLALIVGVAFGAIGNLPTTVEVTSASGSSVSVPGSSNFVDGEQGMQLVDGTRIEVGPGGSITVGGVVLEAGTTALVDDGSVEIIDTTPAPTTTTTSAPPQSGVTATTIQPTPSTGTMTPPPSSPTTEPGDPDGTVPETTIPETTIPETTIPETTIPDTTVPEGTAPKSTLPPESRPTTTQSPRTTLPPETSVPETKPQTTVPTKVAIGVEFTDVGDQVAMLTWNIRETDAAIAGWIVQIKRGDGVANLATIRQPDARSLRVEVSGRALEYRVVARAEGGVVLGESWWLSP